MRTGVGGSEDAADRFLRGADDVFRPVVESAVVLAAHYAAKCGRTDVTREDFVLGLKYAAQNVTGKHLGTLFPEAYADTSDEEEEEEEEEDEEEEEPASKRQRGDGAGDEAAPTPEQPFTRYEGAADETCVNMNACDVSWDAWEPQTPAEVLIKRAVAAASGE